MADKNAAEAVKPATRAYVTLLANDDGADDSSFKGVVRLAKGLRDAGSAYPLVVAVLPDMPESRRRVLVDELGCVVREVQPVYPREYNKLRIWEFVEYDQMMYLDAGLQGSLEDIDELFAPNNGPPPAACVDAEMFVFKPSMATARLLLHGLAFMFMMMPRTTIADQRAARIAFAHGVAFGMRSRSRTTVADRQQAASSSQQINNGPTTARLVMTFFVAVLAVVNITMSVMDHWRRLTRRT